MAEFLAASRSATTRLTYMGEMAFFRNAFSSGIASVSHHRVYLIYTTSIATQLHYLKAALRQCDELLPLSFILTPCSTA